TTFVPRARAWTRRDSQKLDNVRRIAAVLRRLHALPADLPAYRLVEVARGYVRIVGTADARTARLARELLDRARRFERAYDATAFCHNDLVASNVLDDGRTLALIDFEYAVRAAPLLDLAGLAAMNRYSARARAELLAAYHDGAPAPSDREVAETIRTLELLAWFWAEANARVAADPRRYLRLRAEIGAQVADPA